LGVQEAIVGKDRSMDEAECATAFKTFQKEVQARHMKTATAAGEKNKKAGDAFLATNKTKPGVKVLPSGIQYVVLKEGTGKQPKATDEVKVHYHGTLIDGKVFDSSVDRGEPATFRLDQVIPGWTEGVQMMVEGEKRRFWIPAKLAYEGQDGPQGMLVFDIELIRIGS